MSAVATALGLSSGLVAIALAAYAIAAMAKARSLPANGLIGIRTRATRRSETAWIAGHDAARPALLTAAAVGACGAVTATLVGIALTPQRVGEDIVLVLGLSFYVIVLALMGFATSKANMAAREASR